MSMTISAPKTSPASTPTSPKPAEQPKKIVENPDLDAAALDGTKPKNQVEQANVEALAKSVDPQSALRQLTDGQKPISVSQLQTLIGTSGKDVSKGAGAANAAALPNKSARTEQGARVENGKVLTPEGKEAPLDQWLVADGRGGFKPLAENGQVTSPPVRFRMENDELKVEIMNPTKGADRVENFGAGRDYARDPVWPRTFDSLKKIGMEGLVPKEAFEPNLGSTKVDDPRQQLYINHKRKLVGNQIMVRRPGGQMLPLGGNKMTDGMGQMVRQPLFRDPAQPGGNGLFDPRTMSAEALQRGIQSGWLDSFFRDTHANAGGPLRTIAGGDHSATARERAGDPQFLEFLETAQDNALNGRFQIADQDALLGFLGVPRTYVDPEQRERAQQSLSRLQPQSFTLRRG